jgi:hypothetical protein
VFIRPEHDGRFVEEVRGEEPELAAKLALDAELEASDDVPVWTGLVRGCAREVVHTLSALRDSDPATHRSSVDPQAPTRLVDGAKHNDDPLALPRRPCDALARGRHGRSREVRVSHVRECAGMSLEASVVLSSEAAVRYLRDSPANYDWRVDARRQRRDPQAHRRRQRP